MSHERDGQLLGLRVCLVYVRLFNKQEESELSHVSDHGDREDIVASGRLVQIAAVSEALRSTGLRTHQGKAIIPSISNCVHWMPKVAVHSVERKVLIDEEELKMRYSVSVYSRRCVHLTCCGVEAGSNILWNVSHVHK